jgi:hypothetical protein
MPQDSTPDDGNTNLPSHKNFSSLLFRYEKVKPPVQYQGKPSLRCAETGKGMIGHIKALVLFPDGGYLRVSVISPTLPAGVEGSVPANCSELILTLNVIVYGLGRDALEHLARETADHLNKKWKGRMIIKAL